jgi:hypothetical protein
MTISDRARNLLAVLLFLLSWLLAAGSLNLAFLRGGDTLLAVLAFAAASMLWFVSYRIIPPVQSRLRIAGFVILVFWISTLCLAAFEDLHQTVRKPFFWLASFMVLSLFLLSKSVLIRRSHNEGGQ